MTLTYNAGMSWQGELIALLLAHQALGIFLGSVLFGETVIITAAFFAAQGFGSLWAVWWAGLIGTVLSDSLWFWGGAAAHRRIEQRAGERYTKFLSIIDQRFGHRPFLVLLFVKFLYGTRILTIIYLSIRKLPFSTFVVFDTLGTMLWLAVMIGIGWLAGVGSVNLVNYVGYAQVTLLSLVVLIVGIRFFAVWISRRLLDK